MAAGPYRLRRVVPRETSRLILIYVGAYVGAAGFGGVLVAVTPSAAHVLAHRGDLIVLGSFAGFFGAGLLAAAVADAEFLYRQFPAIAYALLFAGPLMITASQYVTGPHWLSTVVLYVPIPISATYLMPRAVAVAFVGLASCEFAIVLAFGGNYPVPVAQWAYLVGALVAIGLIFGSLLSRAVDEAARLGRLKRFLAPQVADAVLAHGTEESLEPHRREVAVFFCDLRGFTNFTSSAEPEEGVGALDGYYHVVGEVLRRHDATVGGFAGDGIMAYLNDPTPCDDPAATAVQMAMELREPMAAFVAAWERKGFSLGFGVGIAFGYATLGIIGFEGRNDYTALGSVVNLASRLCGEAGAGEVLIDSRTADAVRDRLTVVEREVVLKGFASLTQAFAVVG